MLPRIAADMPLAPTIEQLLAGKVEVVPWSATQGPTRDDIVALYTYGHPLVDGPLLDRLPSLVVISNYGVGVDHIRLGEAARRGIPVGNTPGILDGATADMGFCLLLAAARRLVEGDRYSRSPAFTRYDPGFILGREVHGQTLGIIGLGRIGRQVARRARGFEMSVLYHNRRRDHEAEASLGVRYATFDDLLAQSDFVMLCCPLTGETTGLMNAAALARMKPTAILINVSRGPVVETAALTEALQKKQIYAAALDVTDPEPLPRGHPLLSLDNVIIAPHLGSATDQTRQKMAEISVENLIRGLARQPLLFEVKAS
ncbi:MAG: D-glycerate dehydrogenase [Planctomycetaceae bacterium]|nr:D-glycerate dehydrogenase [Planctomycetaceae bacterium]